MRMRIASSLVHSMPRLLFVGLVSLAAWVLPACSGTPSAPGSATSALAVRVASESSADTHVVITAVDKASQRAVAVERLEVAAHAAAHLAIELADGSYQLEFDAYADASERQHVGGGAASAELQAGATAAISLVLPERGADPSEPWASAPYPYPAIEHEPRIAQLDLAGKKKGEPLKVGKGGLDGLVWAGDWILTSSWEGSAIYKGKPGGAFEPAFSNLKNPILRRTVARVANSSPAKRTCSTSGSMVRWESSPTGPGSP